MLQIRHIASREGRVSRNDTDLFLGHRVEIASREGRVSRNLSSYSKKYTGQNRVPRGACE